MDKTYVPASGPIGAKLMILGEAPSYAETEARQLFVGPSGRELDRLLKDAGINRSSCWISNVSKYEVLPNLQGKKIPFIIRAKNAGIDVDQQLEELQIEINSIKPHCILALGGTALWALTGKTKIQDYRGSLMLGMGHKTVPTFHPAHLLHQSGGEIRGYWNRQVMLFDFKRALNQSRFSELVLPKRILSVCKSSAQLADFFERHKGYTKPAIDIEAGGSCLPICIGIAFTPKEGITVPLWNTENISSIPNADLVQIWIMLANFLASHDIVGQNFKYDQDKIRRLGFKIRSLTSDTLLKAFAINPELPKNLAFNTSIYTEEPFYKNEGMYEGSMNDLLLGCARDSCVTKEIDLAMDPDLDELELRPFYENFLIHLHDLYLGIENEGFYIDHAVRDSLIHKYITWSERLDYEIYKLAGTYINVNSPKQVFILLYETLKLPQRFGTGEEHITALINSSKVKDEHKVLLEKILEKRRVDKSIGTYLLALPDFDGKMKTTFFLCLETGRTATSMQEEPIRPSISITDSNGKKKEKAIGASFQVMTKHGDIGQDVRSVYIPEKEFIFLSADSSQAEARVTSLLSNDEKMLSMYDNHDIHALTASWFFGGTEDDYSKKKLGYEVPTRFIGKTLRHAGERGAKGKRAAIEVNTNARKYKIDIKITDTQADAALNIFHRMCPNIQAVYFKEVIECIKTTRMLTAPLPYGIDAPCGGKRIFYERWGDELFREAFSYLPQRAVTDNTKAAMLRIKKIMPDIRIIMEAHDSILFMIREDELEDRAVIVKQEMERSLDFSSCSLPRHNLTIPCELETGYNYMELKKFKFAHDYPLLSGIPEAIMDVPFKFKGVTRTDNWIVS